MRYSGSVAIVFFIHLCLRLQTINFITSSIMFIALFFSFFFYSALFLSILVNLGLWILSWLWYWLGFWIWILSKLAAWPLFGMQTCLWMNFQISVWISSWIWYFISLGLWLWCELRFWMGDLIWINLTIFCIFWFAFWLYVSYRVISWLHSWMWPFYKFIFRLCLRLIGFQFRVFKFWTMFWVRLALRIVRWYFSVLWFWFLFSMKLDFSIFSGIGFFPRLWIWLWLWLFPSLTPIFYEFLRLHVRLITEAVSIVRKMVSSLSSFICSRLSKFSGRIEVCFSHRYLLFIHRILTSVVFPRLSSFYFYLVSELGFSEILSFNSFPTVDLYLEFLIENWLGVNIHPSIDSASSLILGIDYTEP